MAPRCGMTAAQLNRQNGTVMSLSVSINTLTAIATSKVHWQYDKHSFHIYWHYSYKFCACPLDGNWNPWKTNQVQQIHQLKWYVEIYVHVVTICVVHGPHFVKHFYQDHHSIWPASTWHFKKILHQLQMTMIWPM